MRSFVVRESAWCLILLAAALVLSGCPSNDQGTEKKASGENKPKQAQKAKDVKPAEQTATKAPPTETEKPAAKPEPKPEPETKPEPKAEAKEPSAAKEPAEPPKDADAKSADEKPEPPLPPADEALRRLAVKEAPKEKPDEKTALPRLPEEKPSPLTEQGPLDDKAEAARPKIRDLGPPLVDDAKVLTRLDPDLPVWIDPKQKQVVFLAETCKADYPLEFLVTMRDRGYESVMVSDVRPSLVHAGLLAAGAKPGSPAQFQPEFALPKGPKVKIEVRWKDKEGKVLRAPAQQWIRDIKTHKPLEGDWVFGGSGFRKDPMNGNRMIYLGDSGDFIAVLNLPGATLDLPIKSEGAIESRTFEGFIDNIPAKGTPVTVVLTPEMK